MGTPSQHTFAGALGIYTAGGLFWAFLPFFVGLQVSTGGLSEAEAGSLGSAYLIGFSLTSLGALWWVPRIDWRVAIAGAAAVVVVCLWLLQGADAYLSSLATVFAIGLMMGAFWTIAYRIFGATENPDRSFAIGIVVSYTALAAVSYAIGQFVVPDHGLSGSALVLGGIIAVLAVSAVFIPAGGGGPGAPAAELSWRPPLAIGLALIGLLGTALAFAAVWAFAERIGVAAGFAGDRISPVIASNLLASAAGSVLATVLGTRLGRAVPLLGGMTLLVACVLLLLWADLFWLYAIAVSGLGLCVGFALPYQMGAIGAADVESRFVVLIAAAQGLGSAGGAYLGGVAVDAGGTVALSAMATAALVLSAASFGPILKQGATR